MTQHPNRNNKPRVSKEAMRPAAPPACPFSSFKPLVSTLCFGRIQWAPQALEFLGILIQVQETSAWSYRCEQVQSNGPGLAFELTLPPVCMSALIRLGHSFNWWGVAYNCSTSRPT